MTIANPMRSARLEPTRVVRATLPWGPEASAEGRRVAMQLPSLRDRPDHLIDAELVISELVANAVEHGEPPVALRLRGSSWRLRVEVADGCAGRPLPLRTPGMLRLNGRGLVVVDALAQAWGSRSSVGGKVVWAELVWPYQPPASPENELTTP